MARLVFYSGINEIGGNKILLDDEGRKLLLDFGFPYGRHQLFYEEYLKPRSGAGLLDPLVMDLLPPLEGLYRSDLETPDILPHFKRHPSYGYIDGMEGVLLSHAHLDHSGYISFLHEDIPVFSTALTAFIAKSIQDSGKADFDQQVCYFTPVERGCPIGWTQECCLSGDIRRQRQFCVPENGLSDSALRFWKWGFWEKSKNQKELASLPLRGIGECSFNLKCFPVDHSIPGACAWGIETGAGWIIYSGDLRLHGKRADLTRRFITAAAGLNPRALIIEGTNLSREKNIAENDVYENAKRAILGCRNLVFADFSARDADRLLTFLSIAREAGRKLAILPKDAYLLKTLRLLNDEYPEATTDADIVLYQETTAGRYPDLWQRNLFAECSGKTILASDVNAEPDKYILCFSFFDLNELPSILPQPGSLYVFSSSEPHSEEQQMDFRRLHEWLRFFKITPFGVPVEKNGNWEVPEEERGLHASGHACRTDLLQIAREIKPHTLLPVHTTSPQVYLSELGHEMEVVLPEPGKAVEIF